MKKLNLVLVLTAVILVGLTVAFKYANAPTGAVSASATGFTGNIVTLVAVLAIAGIVVLTVLKKQDN